MALLKPATDGWCFLANWDRQQKAPKVPPEHTYPKALNPNSHCESNSDKADGLNGEKTKHLRKM